MRYDGDYRDGVRDGIWRVSDAETDDPLWEVTWSAGEWHGPARSWYRNGQLEDQGEYSHSQQAGVWSYWFENGQMAATGRYEHDRKTGDWTYWDVDGTPMAADAWARKYEDYDWAYDDYTGTPRGENWPQPPAEDATRDT